MNYNLIKIAFFVTMFLQVFSCGDEGSTSTEKETLKEVTVYTHRHYDTDQKLIKQFEEQTGIQVNVVNAKADELIQKMKTEGEQSPADVLITVDAGRLVRAKNEGLLQAAESSFLDKTIPANLRDGQNYWFALTKRARVIAYHKDNVKPTLLSTYEDLADKKWDGKILIRSSGNIYNQSLMASIIAINGEADAQTWAAGVLGNMARSPKGNDRDQVKAVLAGEGDIAVINTYYLGRLLNSKNPEEVKAGESVKVFFPNQNDRGTHINISGAGVAKYSPNKTNAIKFIEFLASKQAQEVFAEANYEYPVNKSAKISDLLLSWGDFKEDKLPLEKLGELNKSAVITFDKVGWK